MSTTLKIIFLLSGIVSVAGVAGFITWMARNYLRSAKVAVELFLAITFVGLAGLVSSLWQAHKAELFVEVIESECKSECKPVVNSALYGLGYQEGFSASTNFYRIWGFTGDRKQVDCGKATKGGGTAVILVFGQSNAANTGETKYEPSGPVYNYNFLDGKCYVARDPLLGAQGQSGSVWSRMADGLVASGVYDKVLLVPFSVGSTLVKNWASGELSVSLAQMIRDATANGIAFTHVLWHQGEADRTTDKESYRKSFLRLVDNIHNVGVNAPVFMSLGTICWYGQGGNPNKELAKLQVEISESRDDVYLGPNTDRFDRVKDRHDGCHFSDSAMDKIAEEWVSILRKYEDDR